MTQEDQASTGSFGYGPIPPDLKLVLYAELILFVLHFVKSYLMSGFKKKWRAMSSTEMGLTELWRGEMRKGIIAFVIIYMVANILILGVMVPLFVETLLLLHALIMGIYIGTMGPFPWPLLDLTLNLHTWLSIGLAVTGAEFTGLVCKLLCLLFLLLGISMNRCAYPHHVFGPGRWLHRHYHRAVVELLRSGRSYCIAHEDGKSCLSVDISSGAVEAIDTDGITDCIHSHSVNVKSGERSATQPRSNHRTRTRHLKKEPYGFKDVRFTLEFQGRSPEGNTLYHIKSVTGKWLCLDSNRVVATTDTIHDARVFELVRHSEHAYWSKTETTGKVLWFKINSGKLMTTETFVDASVLTFRPDKKTSKHEGMMCRLPDFGMDRLQLVVMFLDWAGYKFEHSSPAEENNEPFRFCSKPCSAFMRFILLTLIALGVLISFTQWSSPPKDGLGGEIGQCDRDTGGECNALEVFFPGAGGCSRWRGATCDRKPPHWSGRCVCDGVKTCAFGGMCVPNPGRLSFVGEPIDTDKKTALVLSGGGARGAWEVGVLEGLCRNSSQVRFTNWSLIVGTSIGALNAAFLAQFSPSMQCSHGVPALAAYWRSITNDQDVWESPDISRSEHKACFALFEGMAMFMSFARHGGVCLPRPGAERLDFSVSRERINASGTKLRVLATSLTNGNSVWWNEGSLDVLKGAEASGSIAPLVTPMRVGEDWYIDGGLLHNTPLTKALEEGAETVIVMMPSPLERPTGINVSQMEAQQSYAVGFAISEFELNLMVYRYFVDVELSTACDKYPSARIWGWVAQTVIGSLVDFDTKHISEMQKKGWEASSMPPIDLCKELDIRRADGRTAGSPPAAASATPPAHQGKLEGPTLWLLLVSVAATAYSCGVASASSRSILRGDREAILPTAVAQASIPSWPMKTDPLLAHMPVEPLLPPPLALPQAQML